MHLTYVILNEDRLRGQMGTKKRVNDDPFVSIKLFKKVTRAGSSS